MTPETEAGRERVERIARRLTGRQRLELAHYEPGEGFMPPANAKCAKYLWAGIMPRGLDGPYFLLMKAHGARVYALTPLGLAVRAHLLGGE